MHTAEIIALMHVTSHGMHTINHLILYIGVHAIPHSFAIYHQQA